MGSGLVVDSVHRAGDLPQAPAPSAPGDLLVTPPRTPHQAAGATPAAFLRSVRIRTLRAPRRTSSTERQRGQAMFALENHRSHRRRALAGRRPLRRRSSALVDLFFSEQLDDILRAKAFCVECPVQGRVPRRPPSSGASRGASGAASCSPTARCWPTSGVGAGRRRCGRPSRCSRSSSRGTTRRTRWPRAPERRTTRSPHRRAGATRRGTPPPGTPTSPGPPRSTGPLPSLAAGV